MGGIGSQNKKHLSSEDIEKQSRSNSNIERIFNKYKNTDGVTEIK